MQSSNILTPNEATFGRTTIPVQPTWGIMDSSKISALMDCPRGFFFSHILGWRVDEPALHLAFGSGWHKAMEILMTKGTGTAAVQEAYFSFLQVYQEEMGMNATELEALHNAKTPSKAMLALTEYSAKWRDRPEDTLHVEIAGTAPINDEERVIHTKTDTIRVYPAGDPREGKYYSLEHKTTGRYSQAWIDQWSYIFQVGTYDHFLKCMYGPENVEGVTINGAVFRTRDREFPRVPVSRSNAMWELWINEANAWWDFLEHQMNALYDCTPSDRVMVAFPRNTASCSKFGCKFPSLCSVVANPLQRCHQVPFGMKQDFWDPRRNEEKASKVVHLQNGPEKNTKAP